MFRCIILIRILFSGKGLAGAMFWCLDLDDFTGKFCNQGKYPLITAVKNELGGYTPPPTPSHRPMPHTTNAPYKTTHRQTNPPTKRPTKRSTKRPTKGGSCHAVGVWKGNEGMDKWCVENCAHNNCRASVCKC